MWVSQILSLTEQLMISKIFHHRKLIFILLLYLVLTVSYSIVVPIGRGADEWAHYWYAQFIAGHGRLPTSPAEREAAGYKSDWPPLYHFVAAGLTGWIDTAGPPSFKYRPGNTCACAAEANIRRQLVPAAGPEAILHTEDELFPWRQEILVWHLGRFLSIAFTLGTLLVTYLIALEVFVKCWSKIAPCILALVAVIVLAFNPRFLFTGMLFNYDSLTLLLASLFLWLVIRVTKGHYLSWGFWAMGALAGLALVTKYLAALLPLEIIVLAFIISRSEDGAGGWLPRSFFSRVGQAALAYLLVVGWWFGYLLIYFNEVDAYGPVLGVLAPLLRGDASDRTVEAIFAWLSGGQAPPPAYIEKQSYTAWQIISEFPTTFWGNPITRPYPLNWFVLAMTIVGVMAGVGLVLWWRRSKVAGLVGPGPDLSSRLLGLLLLHCMLPVPFMLVRLFGARDALEAVQGRHILFLAGPAVAILLVWGLSSAKWLVSSAKWHGLRFASYVLLGLLLTGAISQLIYMHRIYPSLLPVQTTPYRPPDDTIVSSPFVALEDRAKLVDIVVNDERQALRVNLIWQVIDYPLGQDYQLELALVDSQGQTRSYWRAYQTQARYPTRTWEAGDIVRDEGWLPLPGLPAGEYEVQMRLLDFKAAVTDWQTIDTYALTESRNRPAASLVLWQNGEVARHIPAFRERETVQVTGESLPSGFRLVGPDGIERHPLAVGAHWTTFIIDPAWPAGDYYAAGDNQASPLLHVVENGRNFQIPAIASPLEANFAGKIKLLGYHLPSRRVAPGNGLPVTLYWQGLQWLGEDFVIFNRLLDNQQVAWGGYDRLPQENYSTLFWAPGEIVTDGFAVPVASDAPDGVYTLSVGWYQVIGGQAQSLPLLNLETGEPTDETAVTIGPIKVGGPPPGITVAEAAPSTPVNAMLGEQIKLLGYDFRQNASSLDFTFFWQALVPPPKDYTVFVHVRNAAGDVVAQQDGPPVEGVYPTSLWDAGEIIQDGISVPLNELAPGQYEVIVGLYDFVTGERLPVEGTSDGTVFLKVLEIGK
jgi:4-amino-4-deoxy-L-arabinose transferase-like glycosyltransferase